MIRRPFRLSRLDRRHLFRDRVLVGMLAVALIPLLAFAALVAVDLAHTGSSSVESAQRTILQDQEQRQQQQVALQAQNLDAQLDAIAGQVRQLQAATTAALQAGPAAAPPLAFDLFSGAYFASPNTDTTVIVGQTSDLVQSGALDNSKHAAPIAGASAALVGQMQSIRNSHPEVEAVWIADRTEEVIRTVPAIDVRDAIRNHRLDPDQPLGPDAGTVFSTSERRMASTGGTQAELWGAVDQERPGQPSRGPYWTDPYATRLGDQGVTVWIPLSNGTVLVGADIAVSRLAAGVLQPPVPGAPGSYPVLLSSSNTVLGAGDAAQHDFGLAARPAGAVLPLSSPSLRAGVHGVESTGHPAAIRAHLGGTDKELFTYPIPTARWVLGTVVPVSDLVPGKDSLVRGIQTGIHGVLLDVLPIAILLALAAFLLATAFARRVVEPVLALTRSAEMLAQGHTDAAVPRQGNDEVGMLADALERMRREINGSRDAILAAARELEVRVADRTLELRSRNEELVALNTLAESLTRSLDPSELLGGAVQAMRAVMPLAAAAGYLERDGHPEMLASFGTTEVPEVAARLERAASAASASNAAVEDAGPAGLVVALPLGTHEGVLGALAALCPSSLQPLSERTSGLLGAVADQVGLALRTAQLSFEGREMAVLEERTRLAREIHDTLAQQLTAIVLQLEAAEAFVARDQSRAREVVVTARELARSALQEARRSVWNLRSADLATTGLVAAVAAETQRWSTRTGISARVRSEGVPARLALRPQAEVALFRVVQEALANVEHHSGAHRVVVRIELQDGMLTLSVRDDGRGFDAAARPRGRFGLVGMSERARLVGAALSIDSAPGRGTRVVARLPIAEVAAMASA